MADLMTASTTSSQLAKKYDQFSAAAAQVSIDGTDIIKKFDANIVELSVELSTDGAAGSASFTVIDEYDTEKSDFRTDKATPLLQLGARVEISLGYVSGVEKVFSGLIAEVEYMMNNAEEAPCIRVTCLDAISLLMRSYRNQVYLDKSSSDVVTELFGFKPFASYISGSQVEKTSEKRKSLVHNGSDYDLVQRLAKEEGYELFISQGKVYFRKLPAKASAIMTLAVDDYLLQSARLSLRSSGLVGKVTVIGVNDQDSKATSATASIQGKFAAKSTAKLMLGESVRTIVDQSANSAAKVKQKADLVINEAKASFGRLDCSLVGLPDIVPGRSIKLKGLFPQADVEAYILKVSHRFTDDGYFTEFEAKVDEYHA
jgi:phage protein D